MQKIAQKAPKEVRVVSEQEHQEDYYKGFRSAVVLVWMFCNFALAAVVLAAAGLERVNVGGQTSQVDGQRSTIYMAVVLWSVAGLSAFRFCGAMWFLVVRLVSTSPLYFKYGSCNADTDVSSEVFDISADSVWCMHLANLGVLAYIRPWRTLDYMQSVVLMICPSSYV